jgi:hypothetical protein
MAGESRWPALAIFCPMPADPARAPGPAFAFLCLAAFAALGILSLSACSGSYCGAPCDRPARPTAPADNHVNQYGSLYAYLEVDSLSKAQLNLEKNSLEFLLKASTKDAEILAALKAEGDSAYAFRYEDYSTGGDRFDASGKLRRKAAMQAGTGRGGRRRRGAQTPPRRIPEPRAVRALPSGALADHPTREDRGLGPAAGPRPRFLMDGFLPGRFGGPGGGAGEIPFGGFLRGVGGESGGGAPGQGLRVRIRVPPGIRGGETQSLVK